ncbi:protein containing DUF185, partial [mine drainage metagenome]
MEPEDMASKTMTFRDYMEWSLFDPDIGYYMRRAKIGLSGSDFVTAPEVSPIFPLLISEQIVELDECMGSPDEFYLIEAGPGNGTLMRSILTAIKLIHPGLFERVHPMLIEKSPFLRQQQERQLMGLSLKHTPVWLDLMCLPANRFDGVIFGNEFLDALPAHWVSMSNGELMEVHVEVGPDEVLRQTYKALIDQEVIKYF